MLKRTVLTRWWYLATIYLCVVYGVVNVVVQTVLRPELAMTLNTSSQVCDMYNPELEDISFSNGIWQVPGNSSAYLYTAYLDTRDTQQSFIRAIGMIELSGPLSSFYCQLWIDFDIPPSVVKASLEEIWLADWDAKNTDPYYRPFLFSCPLPSTKEIPTHVSFTTEPCEFASNLLPVSQVGYNSDTPLGDFAICVKGMDFDDDISLRMVEWIELNRILGANHFFVYIYAVHPNVMRVLRHYEALNVVSIMMMNLPGKQPNFPPSRTKFLRRNVWQKRRNELIPYNDCLYRSIYRYRYVLPIDVDEVPIPVNYYTWAEMFRELTKSSPLMAVKYAGFSVQNAYFFDEINNENDSHIPAHFHVLRTVIRSSNFSKPGYSIKSFVNTSATKTVFNHYPLHILYSNLKENTILPTSLAQMNHYKSKCPPSFFSDCKDNFLKYTVQDTIAWRYMDELIPRVNNVLNILGMSVKDNDSR